ncbi:preprotein translocase subunit TatC [Ureibacillus massiliensis 4400831 = CIP 108448 = CCUG 49529]|uniref:Sec-independent protein translocase protein TatC n=1 Tax=Ureibacillus massiliensis 4400831 = CIP 108448 = CCUG 49529 TaxID=1211035 RepID=A0A0A3IYS4_9BACL|nr:twin-arginine translocase subunit TatC [Ureibacillus massiliensis]KGR89826.1 preprotein translocase subunit TatC [Ureibacillus massiliensis 4400831 = CIP 108448 = CCUG 49529]
MDPYGYNNLSPLDKKKRQESLKEVEEPAKESKELIEKQEVENKDLERTKEEDNQESWIEHITELRKQLIKSALVFITFLIIAFSTINYWFPYVSRGHHLIILGPLEVIKSYTSISVTLSLGLSLPFICNFLWQFAKPGLYEKEQKFIGLYSPIMLVLFVGGLSFGYFVINPMSYQFLVGLGEMNFDVMVTATDYVNFLIMTTIPIGLLFELPIVALFLSSIGLLTANSMKKIRKMSYLIMAIVSALITPPDFISQLLILIPMIGLYEISILIVRKMEIKRTSLAHQ